MYQVDQLMQKLDEQLQLLRQATPLLRQRADQMTNKEAAAVRMQLAQVLDQQTDLFEHSMQARLLLQYTPVLKAMLFTHRLT